MNPYALGEVVQRREVLHGRVWLEQPVTVVSDRDGILAVRIDPGSRSTSPDHPSGPHPWSRQTAWGASVVLQLMRAGDAYADRARLCAGGS